MSSSEGESLRITVVYHAEEKVVGGVIVHQASGEGVPSLVATCGLSGGPSAIIASVEDALLSWSHHGRLGLIDLCQGGSVWCLSATNPSVAS